MKKTITVAHKKDPNIKTTFKDFEDGFDKVEWDNNGNPYVLKGDDIVMNTQDAIQQREDSEGSWNAYFDGFKSPYDVGSPNSIPDYYQAKENDNEYSKNIA